MKAIIISQLHFPAKRDQRQRSWNYSKFGDLSYKLTFITFELLLHPWKYFVDVINSIRNLIKSVLRFLFEYGEFIFVVEVWILLLYKCLLIPQLALELFIRNSWILFGVEIFTATGLKNKFTVYPPPTFRAVFVFLLFWVMTIRSTTHYFNKF